MRVRVPCLVSYIGGNVRMKYIIIIVKHQTYLLTYLPTYMCMLEVQMLECSATSALLLLTLQKYYQYYQYYQYVSR